MSHLLAYWLSVAETLFERTTFQTVILAKNVLYTLLRLAEKVAVNFPKPAENQKSYGFGE